MITDRQSRNGDEREFQARRLVKLEEQRRKLLEAYYANAIELPLLRSEQERINGECREAEHRLRASDATLAEWKEVLEQAIRLVTDCGMTYRRGKDRSRRMLNSAVFEQITVVDGKISGIEYKPPFDLVMAAPAVRAAASQGRGSGTGAGMPVEEFEYGVLVGKARFELATSRSRTVHSNLAELLPEGAR